MKMPSGREAGKRGPRKDGERLSADGRQPPASAELRGKRGCAFGCRPLTSLALTPLESWSTCMSFRIAHPSDAPILAAISMEVWLGTYIRRGVNAFFAEYALQEFTSDKFLALLQDCNEHVIVSENEEGLDGFIRISSGKVAPVSGCSTMEISTLYVQPRHHGKGIGRLLLKRGLDYARDANTPSVWLMSNSENVSAIAFYLRHGFEKVGSTHFRIQDQGYLNDVLSCVISPQAKERGLTTQDQ